MKLSDLERKVLEGYNLWYEMEERNEEEIKIFLECWVSKHRVDVIEGKERWKDKKWGLYRGNIEKEEIRIESILEEVLKKAYIKCVVIDDIGKEWDEKAKELLKEMWKRGIQLIVYVSKVKDKIES